MVTAQTLRIAVTAAVVGTTLVVAALGWIVPWLVAAGAAALAGVLVALWVVAPSAKANERAVKWYVRLGAVPREVFPTLERLYPRLPAPLTIAPGAPAPPHEGLESLIRRFDESGVITVGGFDGVLVTQQFFATDMNEKVLDQLAVRGGDPREYSRCKFWPLRPFLQMEEQGHAPDLDTIPWPAHPAPAEVLTAADLADHFENRFARAHEHPRPREVPHWGKGRGTGNPRETRFMDVWFRLPVVPPAWREAEGAALDCGPQGEFLLHGVLAAHRYAGDPAPLCVLVPGFFDSVEQHYLRDTIGVIYEMGCSVLALDMRGHGDTLRFGRALDGTVAGIGAPPTSLGLFEGYDIAEVVRLLGGGRFAAQAGGPIYLMGYSGGGRAVLRALEALCAAGGPSLLERVRALAINPAVHIRATLTGMNPIFRKFFEGLVALRDGGEGAAGTGGLEGMVERSAAGYGELARHVGAAAATMPFGFAGSPRGEVLAACLARGIALFTEDDPVVPIAVKDQYAALLWEALPPARRAQVTRGPGPHIIVTRKGGHCAHSVWNQAQARAWLYHWFRHPGGPL